MSFLPLPAYEQSENIAELAAALSAFQSEFEAPAKTKRGQSGNAVYQYADIGSCLSAIRKIAPKHKLSWVQSMVFTEFGVVAVTRIAHASGQWMSIPGSPMPVNTNVKPHAMPQAVGSAQTYARRYSLATAFGFEPDEDTDGAINADDVNGPSQRRAPAKAPTRSAPAEPSPPLRAVSQAIADAADMDALGAIIESHINPHLASGGESNREVINKLFVTRRADLTAPAETAA